MDLVQLKARFGELAIEKIKCENILQNIDREQEDVYNKIYQAEQALKPVVKTKAKK
jgi:hypothetical protein